MRGIYGNGFGQLREPCNTDTTEQFQSSRSRSATALELSAPPSLLVAEGQKHSGGFIWP